MATNILKIFNKITNSWESVSGVGLGADPSSTTGTVDLTNYYKKNETYSKNEIDTKVASAGNFDASQYYPKTEVYSKSETDSKIAASGTFDASQYYNKSDIDSKITSIPTFNSNLYYPKTDINALLHDYAKKSELPDFTRYYEKSQIDYAFVKKSEISSLQNQVSANAAKLVDVYQKHQVYNKSEIDSKIASAGNFDASQYYNKSEVDTKVNAIPTFNANLYYPKTETYSQAEVDEKIGAITPFDANMYYIKKEVDIKTNFAHQNAIDVSSELITQNVKEINKKIAGLATKESVYTKAQIDAKIPNLSEYVKNNYTATDLQLNTNVKIKGTLQKDNSEVGDPDEDYITSKYFGENFPVFFDQKINTIAAGSVDNFVLKSQKYTSPAYTFTEKTNEVSLAIIDNFKQFNNFVITFTDTPNKLVLSGPQIGQSGVIKVINAKKINGYDSNLKTTVTLPVLDKLNDTEYFSYYVFSENEILFSRI